MNDAELAMAFLGKGDSKFREFTFAYSACGVVIEDFVNNQTSVFSEEPMYIIKFSIPEFFEFNLLGDNRDINGDELKKEFKEGMNASMVEIWKKQDEEFDDDFAQYCLKYIQYMCKVRKGEVWTIKDRDATIEKLKIQFAAADAILERQQGDYTEV